MGLLNTIGRQLQHPKGWVGKALFAGMTKKTIAHARWTVDLMQVQPDDHVVEVGFGNGSNIALLARRATRGHVTGYEVSATAIEMGLKRNAEAIAQGRVDLRSAVDGIFPAPDGTFDKACTVATMYVIADPRAVFREMYRALRPGGLAAVTFPVRENFMQFKPVAGAEGFHFHELADLETWFSDAGFENVRTERNEDVQFGAHCMLGNKAEAPG